MCYCERNLVLTRTVLTWASVRQAIIQCFCRKSQFIRFLIRFDAGHTTSSIKSHQKSNEFRLPAKAFHKRLSAAQLMSAQYRYERDFVHNNTNNYYIQFPYSIQIHWNAGDNTIFHLAYPSKFCTLDAKTFVQSFLLFSTERRYKTTYCYSGFTF